MMDADQKTISRDRFRLGNPHAHQNGAGGFSALTAASAQPVATDQQITRSRKVLESPYAHLDGDGQFSALGPVPATSSDSVRIDAASIRNGAKTGRQFSYEQIETFARSMQVQLWKNRNPIWNGNAPSNPVDILDPEIAFQLLGYDVSKPTAVGQYLNESSMTDVAGIIDQDNKWVELAQSYSPAVRRFTAAHELGHAVLHHHAGLHRDRPLDVTSTSVGKHSRTEQEANKFATYFLMPAKQVKAEFKSRYLTILFSANADTAFALIHDSVDALHRQYDSRRKLARKLASSDQYNGRFFIPLAQRFGVSVETMAIRLEELGLF